MSNEAVSVLDGKSVAYLGSEGQTQTRQRTRPRRTRSWFKRLPDPVLKASLPVFILILWELATRLAWIDPLFLPPPTSVLKAFYELLFKDRLLLDFKVSAIVVFEGFFIGSALGLLTGIGAGLSSTTEKVLGPTLNSIRQVPPLAWLPLIILWVGAGSAAKIVVISKTVFFPVFMNTLQGIRGVAREYIEVGRVFEFSRVRMLRTIILPASLPSIFVGLRYGAGLAWAMIIAAEMLGGRRGLGYLLTRSQELLLTDQLFLVVIIIGVIGFLVDAGLRLIERRLMRWKRGFEG